MIIVDGKKLAQDILNNLKPFFRKNKTTIAIISVGNNEVINSFIKQKQRAADFLTIKFIHFKFNKNISNELLKIKIKKISKKKSINGIILQLPLPKKFNIQELINIIPKEKDVDVLNEENFGSFVLGKSKILPPSVEVVKFIFKKYNIDIKKKICGIFGLGRLVGFPILIWIAQQKATVFALDVFAQEPEKILKNCDIIISGVGSADLIKKNFIKPGAILIDFGASKINGKIKGDIDFNSLKEKAYLITPTPGGTGPILVAMIYKNLKKLIEKK
jgi:methylenetetrahydrofolate dehydrogenase (NADP+)/methenyltetrahydrofolate cyclohydrolase